MRLQIFKSWNSIFLFAVAGLIWIAIDSNRNMNKIHGLSNQLTAARTRVNKIDQINATLKTAAAQHLAYRATQSSDYKSEFHHNVARLNELEKEIADLSPPPLVKAKLESATLLSKQITDELQQTLNNTQPTKIAVPNKASRIQEHMANLERVLEDTKKIESDEILAQSAQARSIIYFDSLVVTFGSIGAAVLVLWAAILIEISRRNRQKHDTHLVEINARLEKQKSQLSELVYVQQKIATSNLNNAKAMELVAMHAKNLTGADGGLIEIIDGESLVYETGTGEMAQFRGLRLNADNSLSGRAIREGKALICNDTELDSRVDREACRRVNIRSMIVLPITQQHKIIGVLKAYSREPSKFTQDQVDALTLIGGLLTFTLDQVEDIEEKKRVITSLKQTEAQLIRSRDSAEASTHAKSLFLASMSHEIRTPLNGILGATELLSSTALHDEQRDYLQIIEMSSESLLAIINDILDFSKVEAGKLTLEKIDFNLVLLFEDLQKIMSHSMQNRDIELIFEVAPDLHASVNGDPGRLMQILINLVNNAIKFTRQGQVVVSVKTTINELSKVDIEFQIRDNGIGIAKNAFEKLFQAFNQANNSTTRMYGGTGLGLSICKHLVNLMQGKIGVRSRLGKGSTFWFNLILEKGQTTAALRQTKVDAFPNEAIHHEAMILVVDDNLTNQKISLAALAKLGFRAHAVSDGRHALQEVETEKYDLILMDCQMPEMDGYETTRQIRKMKNVKLAKIPILAMTANALVGDREKCISAGMSDYLSKPAKASDLYRMILKWLPQQEETQLETDLATHVDFEQLRIVTGATSKNDVIEFIDIIYAYLQTMPPFINNLESHYKLQQWDRVKACAHSIKGSSANIGAKGLSRMAQKIESLALTHPQDIHSEEVFSIRLAFDGVRKTLLQFMETAEQMTSLKSDYESPIEESGRFNSSTE